MKSLLILTISILLFSGSVSAQKAWCEIKGSVFVTDNPRLANWMVFQEEEDSFAQMMVFKEINRLFADKGGRWHFVNNPGLADHIIYYVTNRSMADFSVYFTDVPTFAGCR